MLSFVFPCVDASREVAEALFAPFDEFPDINTVGSVLLRPPVAAIPVPPGQISNYNKHWKPARSNNTCLFKEATDETGAFELSSFMSNGLTQKWDPDCTSELGYTSFWDNIGFMLPQKVGQIMGIRIRVYR